MRYPGHPLWSPDAPPGSTPSTEGPQNPFSTGGVFDAGKVAQRGPEQKLRQDERAEKDKTRPSAAEAAPTDKPPTRPESTDPPPAKEHEPAAAPEKSEPPAREAAAVDGTSNGAEAEAATELPEAVQKLRDKYKTPEELEHAYLSVRRLQTATAEERNKLDTRLRSMSEYFEDGPDGEPVLRVDRASERMRSERGGDVNYEDLAQEIPVDVIRNHVESEYRKHLAGQNYDQEGIDEMVKVNKPLIERQVASEHQRVQALQREKIQGVRMKTGMRVHEHLKKNPGDKELVDDFGRLMETMPEAMRFKFVNENYLGGVAKVFGWLRMERRTKALGDDIVEAYKLGLKNAPLKAEATIGGAPGNAGRGSPKPRAGGDPDGEFKKGLVDGRPSTLQRLGLG